MRALMLLLLQGLLVSQLVYSEGLKGYDILGLAKQDIKMIGSTIAKDSAIGVLEGTFGSAIPPLEKLINTGKVIAFRAHLTNGTCFRNRACERGEPPAGDIKALRTRASSYEALHRRHPEVKCYLSPRLEHDEKNKELVNSWIKSIKESAPSCEIVCSAFTGYCPNGVLIEKHGNSSKGDVVSNDGESLYDANTGTYWGNGREISLAWIHRFNLRTTGEKTFTPPSKRTAKATKNDMLQINALMEPIAPIPPTPSFCKSIKQLKAPELLKSNSEDYNQGNARDNKPVLIIKQKASKFVIKSPDGKPVACATYYGPFQNGLSRYYVGACSNVPNAEVLRRANSEWVYYQSGKSCYLGNAVRRLGYYR